MGSPEEVNRRHWDDLAQVHGEGDGVYDVEALAAGRSPLGLHEAAAVEALGGVGGLDVLHLQCHIGFDAVRLARLGARVTAADFSAASAAKARAVAARCGVEVDVVEADATALPPALHGRFDVVWATIGVLNWIGDLDAWMRSVAGALRPGGRLALVEIHPLYVALGSADPVLFDFPYADEGPVAYDEPGSYADRDAAVEHTATVEFGHSIGEVVTAALGAGLAVEGLHEGLACDDDPRGAGLLVREADGLLRLRLGGPSSRALPVVYTLRARKAP